MTKTDSDLWASIYAQRGVLADDLETIDHNDWNTPSLCAGWTVRDVVAHLTAGASIGPFRWLTSMLSVGFDDTRHNQRWLARHRGDSPADTLQRFRAIIDDATAPSGHTAAWLGEVIVHAGDIRRPLGITHQPPIDDVTPVANFFARRDFTVSSASLIDGLRLSADDGPFRAGDGPLVTGTTVALVMAMAGRVAYFDDLAGPGLGDLRQRQATAAAT